MLVIDRWYYYIMLSVFERYPLPDITPFDNNQIEADLLADIESRKRAMLNQIDYSIVNDDFSPTRLACIENNLNPKISFAVHSALLSLLDDRGLLDEYYDENNVIYAKNNVWEIRLERDIPNTKYKEQFRFISSDLSDDNYNSEHRFTFWHRIYR